MNGLLAHLTPVSICNRKRFVIALLIIIFSLNQPGGSHAVRTDSVAAGLVAYYSFDDGTAKDSSSMNNTGTSIGVVPVTGVLAGGMRFNGKDSYIQVPHSASLNLADEFTITGWVRATVIPLNDYVPIIAKGNTSRLETAPYAVVYHNTRSAGIVPHTRFYDVNRRSVFKDMPLASALSFNQWCFFAWRYKDGTLDVFKNGVLLGQENLGTTTLAASDLPLEIGRDTPGVTEFFNGDLDEIRIYNRSLSNNEVSELYQQVATLVYLPLVTR